MPETREKQRTADILKKVRQIEIRTRRLVNDAMAGEYHSVFRGQGIDFDEVREYMPGDEVRFIDWNVTARSGTPHIKKFREDRELTLLLAVDLSASGYFGSGAQTKRELKAEIASVLAFSAIGNRDKVGLLLFTDQVEAYIPPQKGRGHILRVIREILFFKPEHRGTDYVATLDFANRVLKRRSILFLISDFCHLPVATDQQANALRSVFSLTNRRHELIAVEIRDKREFDLPDAGLVALEDAETGEQYMIDTGRASTRRKFSQIARQMEQDRRQFFQKTGIERLELTAGDPYLVKLVHFFSARHWSRQK
jgi:uncharacterized protein (DUF58 family)